MAVLQNRTNRIQDGAAAFGGERWQIFCVFLLALIVRAVVSRRVDPVAFDSALYFEMARFIRAGAWDSALSYPYPPLYPLLVAALETIGIGAEAAGLFWSFSLNLMTLLPLYFIARELAGERVALAAMFLWAIHPYAVRLSIRALSDSPAIFFVALALWSGLYALKSGKRSWAVAAGALSGLAYLSRPEGLEAALGLAVLYVFRAAPASSASLPYRAVIFRTTWAAAPLAGWALVASPYIAHISAETGSLTLSKKKSVGAMVASISAPAPKAAQVAPPPPQKTPQIEPPAAAVESGAAMQPPGRLWRAGRNIYIFQQPLVNGIYPVILLLAVWGVVSFRGGKTPVQRSALILLTGVAGLHFLILVGVAADQGADYLGGHHFFLMAFCLVPFAGAGLVAAGEWVARLTPKLSWAITVVAALCAAAILPATLRWRDHRGVALRAAGVWLRDRLPQPRVVVTDSAKFAFHANARRLDLAGDAKSSIDQARKHGAGFAGSYSDTPQSAQLRELVHSGELELAADFPEGPRKNSYQVYRILPKR